MDERLQKLEKAVARCEAAAQQLVRREAAMQQLVRREAALREAARETIDELDRLLKAASDGSANG